MRLIYYLSFIYYFIVTYSASGPNVRTGKNDKAAIIKIITNVIRAKVDVSVLSVPTLSGINCYPANNPAIAICPPIERNRLAASTIAQLMFQ